jgi:hypothetical protein
VTAKLALDGVTNEQILRYGVRMEEDVAEMKPYGYLVVRYS